MLCRLLKTLVIAATVLISAPLWAQNAWQREDIAAAAAQLEQRLRTTGSLFDPSSVIRTVTRRQEPDFIAAIRALETLGTAARNEPRNAERWLAVTSGALRGQEATEDYAKQSELLNLATASAYIAVLRSSENPGQNARALSRLGEVYALRSMWRPALDAYRASLGKAENAAVRSTYQDLRKEHGFRLIDHKVESDGPEPRVCFNFSEQLARNVADFSPYLVVGGAEKTAIAIENSRLCVEGLKHGQRYSFILRQGLPSAVDENLLVNADYDIYIRDRAAQVRFSGKNYVLPRLGQEGIPVISVNTAKAEIDIFRIGDRNLLQAVRSEEFLKQLDQFSARKISESQGVKVWSGQLVIRSELNKDVVTAFPVAEAIGKMEPGLYVMTARPERTTDDDNYEGTPTQWFIVSDLGLTTFAANDGIHVLVRSLATAEPMAGVEIRLVARNNEILATLRSDAQGRVRFDAGLARGTAGLAPGLVVASTSGGDYSFLDLGQSAFDLTDRGVKGRAAPGPLDAFLFTERGVYRGGETVHVTTLLRDAAGRIAAGIPITLLFKRPDGVEYRRATVSDQGQGGRAYSLALMSGAARGTWTIQAFADPKGKMLAETKFLVEDYVPERMDLKLTAREKGLRADTPGEIEAEARYLYGAPGSGLTVSGEVNVRLAKGLAIPGFEAYTTGLDDEAFEAKTQEIAEVTTDDKGKATVKVELPELETKRPLEALLRIRVGEAGGRAVERSLTLPVLPSEPVIAIRKNFKDVEVEEGATVTFDVVVVTPEGKLLSQKGASWNLSRIERSYQWYRTEDRWTFESIKTPRRVASGSIDLSATGPVKISAPVRWGTYRLEVQAGGMATSVTFFSGWAGEPTADSPDLLDVSLDKQAYGAGDTMTLRIKPGFRGKATVAVVADRIHEWHDLDVSADGTTLSLTAKPEWGSGAYVVALAHRPLDQAARRMPGRSLGLAWFSLDKARRSQGIEIGAVKEMRPRTTLEIPVKFAGLAPGEEAHVVVSAVDIGILNLTRYKTPDPVEYYFGQRQLGAEIRDLYGLLIDGMQGVRGAIRSGGDGAGIDSNVSPPREAPLARFSGVVKLGPDGVARISFDIPEFNGAVRIAAIGWSRDKVGHAEADVIIRDPIVILPTMPRFLSLGDQSRFHVLIDNVDAPAGEFLVDLDVRGPLVVSGEAARRRITLAKGAKTELSIPITAAGNGNALVTLRVAGGGVDVSRSLPIAVQPATSGLLRRTVRPLAAGDSITLDSNLVADLVPGTAVVSVSVGPIGAIDVPALLQSLDRYPYGCSEQIVSRALPLLYVNQLAKRELLAIDGDIDERINKTIDRVLARQDSTGSFGLWSIGGNDVWLDAFITDFLTRAREKGYQVPERGFSLALDRLRNYVANATDPKNDFEHLAYAIYVLARNGRPVMGDLRYLVDTKLASFNTPLARAQLSAALALLGDRVRAQTALTSAVNLLATTRDTGFSRIDYGSRLRDGAAIMAIATEARLDFEAITRASQFVEEARAATRFASTQENAWMVLAAQALAREGEALRLTIDGAPHSGTLYRDYKGEALDGRSVTITNSGEKPARIVVSVSGNPISPEPAENRGYGVERKFYKLDGTEVNLDNVKQNDRMVVVLTVTEVSSKAARLLVVDHLPAGLEIDNPKLVDSGAVSGLPWLVRAIEPEHTEYRDDRFVAAYDRTTAQPPSFKIAYMVRAVSPGRFVHPPAVAEDMYRPERFGRTAFGALEVKPVRP